MKRLGRVMASAGDPAVSVVAEMADHGAPVQLPSLLRTVLSAVPPQVWFCADGHNPNNVCYSPPAYLPAFAYRVGLCFCVQGRLGSAFPASRGSDLGPIEMYRDGSANSLSLPDKKITGVLAGEVTSSSQCALVPIARR